MRRNVLTSIISGILLSSLSFGYSGGDGSAEKPYWIASKADLMALAASTRDYGMCFILKEDIDLTGESFLNAVIAPDTDEATGGFQGRAFTGVFDGGGYAIRNLTMTGNNKKYLGLFGYVSSTRAVIKNVKLLNVGILGTGYMGGLAGENEGGTIESCVVEGNVSGMGSYIGGLVGCSVNGTINNCYAGGNVHGQDSNVGGLVGYSNGGVITGSYTAGRLVDGIQYIGGLIGRSENDTVSRCYAIETAVIGSMYLGGLAGSSENGMFSYCYSSGIAGGGGPNNYDIGGLIGQNIGGEIHCCYSTSEVSGSDLAGGLVGKNYQGKVIRCYSAGKVTGGTAYWGVGGLCGYADTGGGYEDTGNYWDDNSSEQSTSAMGTGKSTIEMKMLETFASADWDFIMVWDMGQNQSYPYLRTVAASDLNKDGLVNMMDLSIFAMQWLGE